ncbi:hypothetical protein NP493_569g01087 [Ridgeia piscesae]|uniref:Uncharacterized protein n=1 Tax=Ridgeia piscesae TaxID=27915 RepID=A0AAD9NRI9_RIDPI|nr:hypothetical protein NP493_569g01087 [Ridgeia piscesae]
MSCLSVILPQALCHLKEGSLSVDMSQLSSLLAGLRFTSLDLHSMQLTMQHMSLKSPYEEFQHLCRCILQLNCSDLSIPSVPLHWTPTRSEERELHYLYARLRGNCILDVPADINDLCVQMRTLGPHAGMQYGHHGGEREGIQGELADTDYCQEQFDQLNLGT